MKFFKLLEPFSVSSWTLRNRMIIPAMHLSASENGEVTDQILEFYRRRAQGGIGLIIVGGIGVSPIGQGVPNMLSIFDDRYILGLRKLTEAIHREGATVCAQLYHAGAYAHTQFIGEQAISSSAIYSRFTHATPREITPEEIPLVQATFVNAARRALQAGFDGVELVSSAGYLLDQFLSPLKNKRTDQYGGETLEERLRFPLEVISQVKTVIGSQMFLGCRLSGDDFVRGSNTYHEKRQIAQAYERAGVQFFNVTGGWHETRVPQLPMDTPKAAFAYLAKEIRSVVKSPVFASNRINEPEIAEMLLQDGYADAICFGRPMIADPDLPLKIQQNRLREIRKCIGCNQGCFDAVFNMEVVSCSVNPYAMNELRYAQPPILLKPKKIIILGAGPASLEAACTAKLFGHDVVIYEKQPRIGGQLNVAWIPPGREEIRKIIEYYQNRLRDLNISIKLGTQLTPAQIVDQAPDVIWCGTGVQFNIPSIRGVDGSLNCNVCFADDALDGNVALGKRVVIIGAAATGVETALWVARRGAMSPESARFLAFYNALSLEEAMQRTFRGDREVFLLEYLPKIGSSIGKSTKWVFLDELKLLKINVQTNVNVQELRDHTVFYKMHASDTKEQNEEILQIKDVDNIILATGVLPDRSTGEAIKEFILTQSPNLSPIPEIHYIGDAKKIGTLLDAIHSGFKTAFKLGQVQT